MKTTHNPLYARCTAASAAARHRPTKGSTTRSPKTARVRQAASDQSLPELQRPGIHSNPDNRHFVKDLIEEHNAALEVTQQFADLSPSRPGRRRSST